MNDTVTTDSQVLLAQNLEKAVESLNSFERTISKLRRDIMLQPWSAIVGSGQTMPVDIIGERCLLDLIHNPSTNNAVQITLQDGATGIILTFNLTPMSAERQLGMPFRQGIRLIASNGTVVLAGRILW